MAELMRLTDTVAKAASPSETPYFVWDKSLKGFGLRVMPSGIKAFFVQYRVGKGRGGRERRVTIGKVGKITCESARRSAEQFLASAIKGEDLRQEEAEAQDAKRTVSQAIDLWIKEAASTNRRNGTPRRPENMKLDIDRLEIHVRPLIGARPLVEITRVDIERMRDAITDGRTKVTQKTRAGGLRRARGGSGTAARSIRVLSSVFAHAEDRGYVSSNPCRAVRLQPARKCERYLSQIEARHLGEVLTHWEKQGKSLTGVGVIRLLSLTGARRREITNLKWSEIDFDQGFLRLEDSKTGRSIRPLSGVALQFLRDRPRSHKIWVFPSATGESPFQGVQKAWLAIRKEADLEDVRLHDLRHSFASFGVAAGLSLPIIGALLGHKDAATTQRYAHLANDSARRAADGVANIVAGAFGMVGADV